ncbi:DUF3325 domain-containing protein [Aquincola sp. MAHUQ-54]|uniref:DUF3325 domain-containing protein n=1 Tax=Aquincola agrisoli TaxID=3119538 RepID=A0AAW9QMM7_9BURK
MRDGLLLLAAVAMNVAGLGWFALAMEAHWRQVCGTSPMPPRAAAVLRGVAAVALAGSLGLCLQVDHASMAAIVWVMTLAGGALVVAFTLAWRAAWLRWLLAWMPAAR